MDAMSFVLGFLVGAVVLFIGLAYAAIKWGEK